MIKKLICLFWHRKHWEETGNFGNEESDYTCLRCFGWWYVNNKTGEIKFPKREFWYNYDLEVHTHANKKRYWRKLNQIHDTQN